MKKVNLILVFLLSVLTIDGICQKSKATRYFGEPLLTDSLSTIFLPTRYNEGFLSANKITLLGDYYANIVVYDFKADSHRKLFETDTYIEAFHGNEFYRAGMRDDKVKNLTAKWVFLMVKSKDSNNSGRIDENDASILFVTTIQGKDLTPLTSDTENVVSFDIFSAQGFGLIKIQRDGNKDKSFKNEDGEFYYRKIDLNDLSFGNMIEL